MNRCKHQILVNATYFSSPCTLKQSVLNFEGLFSNEFYSCCHRNAVVNAVVVDRGSNNICHRRLVSRLVSNSFDSEVASAGISCHGTSREKELELVVVFFSFTDLSVVFVPPFLPFWYLPIGSDMLASCRVVSGQGSD